VKRKRKDIITQFEHVDETKSAKTTTPNSSQLNHFYVGPVK
jgi:hypothetical protein